MKIPIITDLDIKRKDCETDEELSNREKKEMNSNTNLVLR